MEPVPGEIVITVVGALATGIAAQWRRNITLEDRQQENVRELTRAMQETSLALRELVSELEERGAS